MIKGLFRKNSQTEDLEQAIEVLDANKEKYAKKRKDGTLCINDSIEEGEAMLKTCRIAIKHVEEKLAGLKEMEKGLLETVNEMKEKYDR